MGTLVGHVAHGVGFVLIGLWHLYNNIKLHSLHPKGYRSLIWFAAPKLRQLELLVIASGSCVSITMELFVGPDRHQPLDSDFTIPSNHLQNFDHAFMSLTFLLYATFAAALDRANTARPAAEPLTILAASTAFAQELLLFHLHSSDHIGVEGQYHWLLQLVIAVSLATTLMGIGHPRSFAVAFVRSLTIAFQGIWLIIMGYALYMPSLMSKGCFMNPENGHMVVRCRSQEALHRAKALVNFEFCWLLVAVLAASLLFYLLLSRRYTEEAEYASIVKLVDDDVEDLDVEANMRSFVSMGKTMRSMDLEM
ncbi:hypothetical protein HPP92_028679 [Vanilla planifolia]|uniref:Uncharacterized protein n=1 Tax=Vanilla planifolia TaxID=51239 RepID=A0A835U5G2_VANPL|nr:hypothetical protein HPP92_028679 [Vanilla planifolia]KAG0446816.1 hypothetical protein HPP92_028664 [Vanilla planifolia]